jgi:CheY-like chemotaxis protein
MRAMHILVLGPDGPARERLEDTLGRLGHTVSAKAPHWAAEPPEEGDVIVLDLREGDQDWRRLSAALRRDDRPLVVVADTPRRLVWALSGRPAGMMVLTGAETDGSFRVALSVCGALRQTAQERGRRGIILATGGA